MAAGVYEIKNVKNGIRYVGSAKNIAARFWQHKRMLIQGNHHSIYLQRAWNKYGAENFKFNVIAVLEIDELIPTEQRLLNIEHQFQTYNVSKDAVAFMKGRKHTDEWIKKSREWKKGNKSRTGIPSHWSKDNPPPSLAKLIEANKNKSVETRKKMSLAKIGKSPWNKGKWQSHCKRGHEMTGSNVYMRPDRGVPCCRSCLELNRKERNLK